jgi:hypothetical protein
VPKAAFRQGIEPFDVGRDSTSPVNPDSKAKLPFAFTGTIDKVTFEAAKKGPCPFAVPAGPADPPLCCGTVSGPSHRTDRRSPGTRKSWRPSVQPRVARSGDQSS